MKPLLPCLLLLPALAFGAELTTESRREITHLIDYLQEADCQFNRNGTWYSTTDAVKHLNRKYDYLLRKNLVSSAEQFISRAGSESSITGKAYEVRCEGEAAEPSKAWLTNELHRFRNQQQAAHE